MELKYKPGTKGHVLAIGSEGNTVTFDVAEDGGILNLRPTEEVAADEPKVKGKKQTEEQVEGE